MKDKLIKCDRNFLCGRFNVQTSDGNGGNVKGFSVWKASASFLQGGGGEKKN